MKKRLLYSIGSIVAVFLIAATTVFLLYLNKSSTTQPDTAPSVSVASLNDAFATTFNDSSVTVLMNTSNSSTLVASPVGARSWVRIDNGSAFLVVQATRDSKDARDEVAARAISVLTSNGLSERALLPTPSGNAASTLTTRAFISSTVTCNARNSAEATAYHITVECARVADFDKNTKAVQSFVDLYAKSKKDTSVDAVFGKPDIQISVTKGYKNAALRYTTLTEVSDATTAMFYQTPDEAWHFFTLASSAQAVACRDYSTPELIDAFLGFSCFDSTANTQAFVKKSNPTFEIVPGSQG